MAESKIQSGVETHLLSLVEKVQRERLTSSTIKEVVRIHDAFYGYLKFYGLVVEQEGLVDVVAILEDTILFLLQYAEEKQTVVKTSELFGVYSHLNGFMIMYSLKKQ